MNGSLDHGPRRFRKALVGVASAVALAGCLTGPTSTAQEAAYRPAGSADERGTEPDPIRAEPAPVTVSVQDIDITELLQMFSKSRGLNIVCGEDVSGRVSLELRDVPFDQALDSAVSMAGCQAVKRGDIYFVNRIAREDPNDGVLKEVRTFRLDYAPVTEIQTVVTQMLSRAGRVTNYPPLRSVVVEDRPDVLERVASVIAQLDRPPRQVLIEAKIIEARLARDMIYGIDWSLLFSSKDGSGSFSGEGFTTPAQVRKDGVFVTWGTADFQATLESIEGIDELNTLAAPRLLAVDGTEAEIIIGGELGFSVVTTLDNSVIQSVEFLDVGAQLRITPTIADDGYVLMKIHPELSDGVIDEGLPSKTTAEVTTNVLIKDGQTLFIGGLIRERSEQIRRGIPLLVRIPLLGMLFGKTSYSTSKSELITLITPRIVQPGESPQY
jgi:type II secretory pathway component GspD/PulD (secretin)